MFILSRLRDAVRIIPELFDKDMTSALTAVLNEKYSGRVLSNVGLCISVYEVTGHSVPMLHPCDGASFCTVDFRMVVFRPFVGEVLSAKIVENSLENGVRLSVGFFDQIWVPPGNLKPKAVFDKQEELWTHEYVAPDEEGNVDDAHGEPERNYLENDLDVHFSVVCLTFDLSTKAPFAEPTVPFQRQAADAPKKVVELPMKIIASFADDGLGPTCWWEQAKDAQ